jgi:hypothetical protein
MAQLTLYLPDDLAKELKRAAKRAKKSLSAYVAQLAGQELKPTKWPKSFTDTFGAWAGDFPEIKRLPYEQREEL